MNPNSIDWYPKLSKVFEKVPFISNKKFFTKVKKNHKGRLKNNPSIIAVSVIGPVKNDITN